MKNIFQTKSLILLSIFISLISMISCSDDPEDPEAENEEEDKEAEGVTDPKKEDNDQEK